MSDAESITQWVDQARAGDHDAAQKLWNVYFKRLLGLAKAKLPSHKRQGADEEDIALSALKSFFRCAELGKFPQLRDRDELWRLLAKITQNKIFDQINREKKHEHAGESALESLPDSLTEAQLNAEFARLLDVLGEEELRLVAMRRMEGFTLKEIGKELGCVSSTVELKINRIRKIWSKEIRS